MKLLVFAHRPPPVHGQSLMIGALLDGFLRRPELGIVCHHIDARVSTDLDDVGRAGLAKLFRLGRHVVAARRAIRREPFDALYYIPAPGQRTPLRRDWLALPLLRRALPKSIFHWQGAGLGLWLREQARPWERRLSRHTHGHHTLSIVHSRQSDSGLADLQPQAVVCVPNGVPDPRMSAAGPARAPESGRILFLGLCCHEKGLFDALETIAQLNAAGGRYHLDVGGGFPDANLRVEFEQRVRQRDLQGSITYHGFLDSAAKAKLLARASVFLFPTFYQAESMPLVLLEAMAWGIPIVTTRWRGLPEFLPPSYPGLATPRAVSEMVAAVTAVLRTNPGPELRCRYEREYTVDRYLEKLAAACQTILPTFSTLST